MNDELRTVIEEKFTRCPQCRHFSVRQTNELTFDEKLKAKWVSATAFVCDNCGYRYVEFGSLSDALKNSLNSLYGRINKKWLLIGVPIIVVVITVGIILLLGWERTSRIHPGKKDLTGQVYSNTQIPDKKTTVTKNQTGTPPVTELPKENQNPVDQNTKPTGTPGEGNPQAPIQDIILGSSHKFGVNWITVSNGVQIAKMSEGPLKSAGLIIGDIVSEADNKKVNNNSLTRLRNEIADGKRSEVILKVYRDNQLFLYRLIKSKREKKDLDKKKEEQVTGKKESNVQPPVSSLQPPLPEGKATAVKVFTQSILKIRSSSPSSNSEANKWKFSQKSVSIRREVSQRVFIAGDPSGLKKWGVDDQLIVNGTVFRGIVSDEYHSINSFIPEEIKTTPVEITSLVPVGKNVQLNFILADHGKLWGNSDIYIVIK